MSTFLSSRAVEQLLRQVATYPRVRFCRPLQAQGERPTQAILPVGVLERVGEGGYGIVYRLIQSLCSAKDHQVALTSIYNTLGQPGYPTVLLGCEHFTEDKTTRLEDIPSTIVVKIMIPCPAATHSFQTEALSTGLMSLFANGCKWTKAPGKMRMSTVGVTRRVPGIPVMLGTATLEETPTTRHQAMFLEHHCDPAAPSKSAMSMYTYLHITFGGRDTTPMLDEVVNGWNETIKMCVVSTLMSMRGMAPVMRHGDWGPSNFLIGRRENIIHVLHHLTGKRPPVRVRTGVRTHMVDLGIAHPYYYRTRRPNSTSPYSALYGMMPPSPNSTWWPGVDLVHLLVAMKQLCCFYKRRAARHKMTADATMRPHHARLSKALTDLLTWLNKGILGATGNEADAVWGVMFYPGRQDPRASDIILRALSYNMPCFVEARKTWSDIDALRVPGSPHVIQVTSICAQGPHNTWHVPLYILAYINVRSDLERSVFASIPRDTPMRKAIQACYDIAEPHLRSLPLRSGTDYAEVGRRLGILQSLHGRFAEAVHGIRASPTMLSVTNFRLDMSKIPEDPWHAILERNPSWMGPPPEADVPPNYTYPSSSDAQQQFRDLVCATSHLVAAKETRRTKDPRVHRLAAALATRAASKLLGKRRASMRDASIHP